MTIQKTVPAITFSAVIAAAFTMTTLDLANAESAQSCKSGFVWDSAKNKCVRESSY